MRLSIIHLRHSLPVVAYEPPDHPEGEAVWLKMPTMDPVALGLKPGMDGDLEFDDGRIQRVRVGRKWSPYAAGSDLRLAVDSIPSLAS